MDGAATDPELLGHFADLVELSRLDSLKGADRDADSQKWVGWLLPKARQQGWIRLCVERKLLPEAWLHWPNHSEKATPKSKVVKAGHNR